MPRRFTIRVRGTIRRTVTIRQVRRQRIVLEPIRQPMLPITPEAELCPVHDETATITIDDTGQRQVTACCEAFKAHIERRLDSAA